MTKVFNERSPATKHLYLFQDFIGSVGEDYKNLGNL